jgi:hypothetical protein
MAEARHEPKPMHQLRNQLAVVITFAELLLQELPGDDPHRADVMEIHKAGIAAMHLIPDIIASA